MMSYYFYLARCADNSLYAGYCKDVEAREKKHNTGKGAKYTRGRRPVQIIYFEEFEEKGDALKREAEVKRFPKAKKELLISKRRQ